MRTTKAKPEPGSPLPEPHIWSKWDIYGMKVVPKEHYRGQKCDPIMAYV